MPDPTLADSVRERLQINGARVADLHLWRVGPGHTAVIAALVSDHPQDPVIYKGRGRALPRGEYWPRESVSRPPAGGPLFLGRTSHSFNRRNLNEGSY